MPSKGRSACADRIAALIHMIYDQSVDLVSVKDPIDLEAMKETAHEIKRLADSLETDLLALQVYNTLPGATD